jgi:anti-sigma B factor antagonist
MRISRSEHDGGASGPATFSAREGTTPGEWRLVARGEIDVATAPELRRQLHDVTDRNPTVLVLDLHEVTFIDSSGLGVLVGVLKRLREKDRGDVLVLEGLQDTVQKVFDITGLTDLFKIR